jgi:hypothetical protein
MREGVEGVLVVTLEDAKDLFNVGLAARWQVMNLSHDLPYTMRLDVLKEVAIISNWICVGPLIVYTFDQGDATIGTTHEVRRIESTIVSPQGVLVVQVNPEIALRG